MTQVSSSLPPIGRIQRALRNVTERLTFQVDYPGAPRPRWTQLEWRLAPAVAAMHGVSPLLASAALQAGPPDWLEFLEAQREMALIRHRRLMELLDSVAQRARRDGIPIVALKGAALCALGVYAAGERPMADLDLLVSPSDLEPAARMLTSLGYHDSGTTWKHRAFEADRTDPRTLLGEHADNPLKIDLHSKIAERLPLAECELTSLVFPRSASAGLNGYDSLSALLLHVLLHAAGSMVHRGLRLVQLVDIARLAERMTGADWAELVSYGRAERRLWWAFAPLALARRYLSLSVPSDALARLESECPKLLRFIARRRTLTAFSYSHVFIDAVPGIVWVRSGTEMLRYMVSRVLPNEEKRAQLALLAHTQPWAGSEQWYGQSQARRALEWLTSRPTRVETMQPVRAALVHR
jgi:hypothetical protein